MSIELRIPLAGAAHRDLVIHSESSCCSNIEDGIAFHFEGGIESRSGAIVMSWPEFEAAYLELKRLRSDQNRVPSRWERVEAEEGADTSTEGSKS